MSDGGPAFPGGVMLLNADGTIRGKLSAEVADALDNQTGMSLRDYFAGQALNQRRMLSTGSWYADDAAREAYEIADAMLKARER